MEQLIEKWAKLPSKQRYAIIALSVLALIGGYYYFIYSDSAKKLDRLHKQYRSLEAERAKKQAVADNLAKYEARLQELQQDLNLARSKLPDEADVAQLLAQLGNKGRQSGLVIEEFAPEGEQKKDDLFEIGFGMKVSGSYHEIGTFVDSLGKLDRIINVTGISMTKPAVKNQKVVVNGSFDIKTYRFVGGG